MYAVSPVATRGLEKVSGHLIPTAPGTEPEVLDALGKGSASGAAGDGPHRANERRTTPRGPGETRREGWVAICRRTARRRQNGSSGT